MADYNLPDVYKQTTALAKAIMANEPKMSLEDAMAKAGTHLGKQDKWETQDKPSLEKTFGALQPATFNQNAVARLRNTPEVVARRKKHANEFLDQPTEAWTPPRTEIQAFDRTSIKDALGGFPDVEQTKFQRDVPARSSLTHVHSVYEDPENRALIKKQIARGLPLGGETFYASLYPVKLAAMNAGIPPEKFDAWIHSIAPASARNSILNEMAVGQAIRDAHAHGSDLSPESMAKVRAEYKATHGVGLPMMPVHEEGVANVLQNNLNLRDLSKANIPTNYKIPTYGTQKAGDFAHSWVGDVHEATGETLGSEHHPYFTTAGGFKNPEYGAAENHMLDIAKEMGIPGGTAQAGRWFGGGELTGLKSPRGDALDLLEKQVAYTLHHQGITPTPSEVRNYVLQMIGTGKGHLLPWFKKAGLPDMRVKNKKEGGSIEADEPSHDEMLAHVMLHGMSNLKDIGANEAPNMPIKTYVPQGPGPGFPVGGVDFQPEVKGQQMLPGQPNAPMGAVPPQPGQPAGQMPPSGQPPAPAPGGPQSNILQMTPQGQAMAAMKASPPMAKMASGGSVDPQYPSIQEMIQHLQQAGRTSIVPAPNRWFADPVKHPHQQKMIERVLAQTGQGREGFPSGSYINPQTGEPMDFDIMHDLGVAIDPKTGRPMMSGIKSDLTEVDPKYGSITKSNLVRKGLFKHEGGDELLKNLAFLATIEKSGKGHHYGLSTQYASPAELVNTMTGQNPTLRPHSRGDIFGMGDEVGRISIQGKHHPVYEKLLVAPAGSDVPGRKLHKAAGGTIKDYVKITERPL